MHELTEDYYAILGVDETASSDELRKSYLKLAKRLHPDRFPNDVDRKAEAQAEFSKVSRAHEVLSDSRQRQEYDAVRTLVRQRRALDTGFPGMTPPVAMPAGEAPKVAQPAVKSETKESWAAKHSERAKESLAQKQFQEAETAVKEAIRLDPKSTKYHLQLAEVYLARNWKTLALTEVQTALRLDPQDNEAKQLEVKLKAAQKPAQTAGQKSSQKLTPGKHKEKKPTGGGILDSISKLLGKK